MRKLSGKLPRDILSYAAVASPCELQTEHRCKNREVTFRMVALIRSYSIKEPSNNGYNVQMKKQSTMCVDLLYNLYRNLSAGEEIGGLNFRR